MPKPRAGNKRRKRSHLRRQDCLRVLAEFSKRVKRFGETSAASMFSHGEINLPTGLINVQFCMTGTYGDADAIFEAIRVLAGHKLPARAPKHKKRRRNVRRTNKR